MSTAPKPPKSRRIGGNIDRCAFGFAVAEIIPDEKRVRALVDQGIVASVAQHVRVDRYRQPGQLTIALNRMPNGAPVQLAALLRPPWSSSFRQ